jgi:glycolate oxidase
MFDGRREGELQRAEELAGEIVQLCIELGGSITGEHGVGMEKRQFLPAMFSEESLECMKRIRKACDPHEISNRGKMFPDAEAPALSMYGLHPLEKEGVASRM